DVRRFPIEAGCRVGKSRQNQVVWFALSGRALFLWFVSFWAQQKEMNPTAIAGGSSCSMSDEYRQQRGFHSPAASGLLFFACPLRSERGKPVKKSNQKKRPSPDKANDSAGS